MGTACEPWLVREAIDVLHHLLDAQHAGLEWSMGSSTLWALRRLRSLHSVEHQGAWVHDVNRTVVATWQGVSDRLTPSWTAVHERCVAVGAGGCRGSITTPLDNYSAYIAAPRSLRARPEAFDYVLVDGRSRAECLREALAPPSLIASHGLLVLDNAERSRYSEAIAEVPTSWLCFGFRNSLDETVVWMACGPREPSCVAARSALRILHQTQKLRKSARCVRHYEADDQME